MARKPKRELSQAQFDEQLRKHGFERDDMPLFPYFRDSQDSAVHIGGVLHPRTFKLLRRATIRHLLSERKRRERSGTVTP